MPSSPGWRRRGIRRSQWTRCFRKNKARRGATLPSFFENNKVGIYKLGGRSVTMGLSGLDIFKKLPKTNCKECNFPTCLAFAMKLAAGQASLDDCPYVTDEVRAELAEASAPPIRGVTVGVGDEAFKVGEELVLFRHEKTFFNPAVLGILIRDA